jgi:YVTN family beta-propeller protein
MSDHGLPTQLGLPHHLLTQVGSPTRENRLTGVDELARLVTGADLTLAAAAWRALEGLTHDDSRSVSAAAAAVLARSAVRLNPERVDFGQVAPGTPRLVADVLVEGPPLAVATATVTVSGPGLRAMLGGRQLRIVWQPRSEWLDGAVSVRGPAGWADVRVTGHVAEAVPITRAAAEAQVRAVDGPVRYGPARVTGMPPPRRRRPRAGAVALIAGLTALVVLGGIGVAAALVRDDRGGEPPANLVALPTAQTSAPAEASAPTVTITKVPLAQRVGSLDKPVSAGGIRVGAEPEGVIVAPDSRTLYVANQNSKILSIVDAATQKVTSIKLRNTPRFVAISRDGRRLFVSMYENDKKTGSGVAVVDTAARKVLGYVKTGNQPFTLAVGPDGRLWVPIHSEGRVEIYSAGDQKPDGRIEVPANPHAVAFSADQMRAFTPNHESNAVSVIDMRTDKLLKSIPVSKAPHNLAVSPDGRRVLVAGFEADAADLIDAVTLKRTGPFPVGKSPQCVAFSTDGKHAYVVNEGDNTVTVLDGRTGRKTATVGVGKSPRMIAMSPDGRYAYVTNGGDNTVSVLRVGE